VVAIGLSEANKKGKQVPRKASRKKVQNDQKGEALTPSRPATVGSGRHWQKVIGDISSDA
jgi:hypothetical protein